MNQGETILKTYQISLTGLEISKVIAILQVDSKRDLNASKDVVIGDFFLKEAKKTQALLAKFQEATKL